MDLRRQLEQGMAAQRAGRMAEAEKAYRMVLRTDGGNFAALHMLGFLKAQQGRFDEAITLLNKAMRQNPQDLTVRAHHAHALMAAERLDEALSAYDALLKVQPSHFEALYNRGVILSRRQRFEEALAALDAALLLKPDTAAIHHNRGTVLTSLERQREALESYDRALALDPGYHPARANRAMVALSLCDWDRVAATDAAEVARTATPLTLLGYSDDKQLQLECAGRMIKTLVPEPLPPLWRGERYRHDRIRLAYVSADFREHAVAFQIAPLIERHDRSRFQVIGISIGARDESPIRARLERGFDRFHDFAKLNSEDIARCMRDMEIDVAIDLGGHTGQARPRIFAHRPAPVQAGWLGYPGTSGAPFLDYLICDAVVAPFDDQPYFTEQLVHLPHSYFPTDPQRETAAAPSRLEMGLPETGFVFCAFNNAWKITRPVFQSWMRLLGAVPQSILWLKETTAGVRANFEREAAAQNVDSKRLIYAADLPIAAHLARHALADLFLDTAPYNAHATAADALGAGLPLLTMKGASFPGRVAASLLTAAGLPELVAADLAGYETMALELTRDRALLGAYRDKLRQSLGSAPLFDADRFHRDIETVVQTMHGQRRSTDR